MEQATEYGVRTATRKTVSLVKCASYEAEEIRSALRRALEPLGGIEAFVKSGQRVLLKPNLLSAKDPARAITTHPHLVEAVAEEVRRVGAVPFIGDSPGGAIRGIKRVWANTGMEEMARRAGTRARELRGLGLEGESRSASTPSTSRSPFSRPTSSSICRSSRRIRSRS